MGTPHDVLYLDTLALAGLRIHRGRLTPNFLAALSRHPDNIMDLLFRGGVADQLNLDVQEYRHSWDSRALCGGALYMVYPFYT